jgi:hypothetical protein
MLSATPSGIERHPNLEPNGDQDPRRVLWCYAADDYVNLPQFEPAARHHAVVRRQLLLLPLKKRHDLCSKPK